MPTTDLKFFTNEPERTLYDRFNKILKTNTQYFDVIVGYFRTSGFFRLCDAMKDLDKIRILVGLNVDKTTVDLIEQSGNGTVIMSQKESKQVLGSQIENEFADSEDSKEVEDGVRCFVEWLKSGKLELRMYTEQPIHAKVYIMRKNPELCDYYGSVITGSSNFSYSGLVNNLEFNVELKDSADVKFALERFEELWAKAVDVSQITQETIQEKTWIKDNITPYELYLKTVFEYFDDEINADQVAMINELFPEGYMKLQYQIDAIIQAKKILEKYNGVFISDVVGLGKTYICALLAKSLKNKRRLVICPPVLVDYWESVLKDFDVVADVWSLGKLDHILENPEKLERYDYVFVDEAHRFRNAKTEGYEKLHQICYGKKVVLISATPINNYASDIENQVYLFQAKHNSNIIPNVTNLEGFFSRLRSRLNGLEKGTPEYFEQLRENSEEIRDRLLRHVMVRRTRTEIKEYYSKDLQEQGLKFPALGNPESIVYAFDEKTEEIFNETVRVIRDLSYARYKPLFYLKDNKKYAQMLVAQANIGGFMKSILVKRLESSFYAFKMTLSRFIESHQKFVDMFNTGEIYVSKKVDVYDLLDNGDDYKLMQLVESEKVQYFKAEEFKDYFISDIEHDLKRLQYILSRWEEVTVDPKLEEFVKDLAENPILKDTKKIVFTESKETASYIGERLKQIYGSRVVVFSGESTNYLKQEIEDSYNPKNKGKNNDKYDILITTDVLAEGINLHRANVLINYDLPWNPTRIMQRVGRINRVGTEFDRIYVFNFFPTSQANAQLPLKDRILEKLQAFHDILGEDFKYLSEDEQVSSHKLYETLTGSLEGEEENVNPELEYLALIRKIRDENIDLFEKIKKLPLKCKSGKNTKHISGDGTISFIRKGALKAFFKTVGAVTQELTFIETMQYVKCDENEPKIPIKEIYFDYLATNKEAFNNKLLQEELETTEGRTVSGNDKKILMYLKALLACRKFTESEEATIEKIKMMLEYGELPQATSKQIVSDLKNVEDPIQIFHVILDAIPAKYFDGRKTKKVERKGKKQVILSCYLEG